MKSSSQKKSLSPKKNTQQQQQQQQRGPRTRSARKNSTKSKKVIILGPPGGGKGTISKKMVNDFNFVHISTGDLIRKEIADQTPLGQQAQGYIKSGQLVPDDLIIDLVAQPINVADQNQQPILLDGFPRTLAQAESLGKKVKIDAVFNLSVPDSEITERATSRWTHPGSGRVYSYTFAPPKVKGKDDITGEDLVQREDDKLEVVAQRLKTYHTQTFPLLDYYQNQGLLTQYDGSPQPELLAKGRRSDAIYVDLKNDTAKLFDV
jgi:adenylate kinase